MARGTHGASGGNAALRAWLRRGVLAASGACLSIGLSAAVANAETDEEGLLGGLLPSSVTDLVEETVGSVVDSLAPATDPVRDLVEPVTTPVRDTAEEALEPVTTPVRERAEAVVETVEPVVEPVTEPVNRTVDAALEPVTEITRPVTDRVTDTVGTITEPVGEVVRPVTDSLQPVTDGADEIIDDVVPGPDPAAPEPDPGAPEPDPGAPEPDPGASKSDPVEEPDAEDAAGGPTDTTPGSDVVPELQPGNSADGTDEDTRAVEAPASAPLTSAVDALSLPTAGSTNKSFTAAESLASMSYLAPPGTEYHLEISTAPNRTANHRPTEERAAVVAPTGAGSIHRQAEGPLSALPTHSGLLLSLLGPDATQGLGPQAVYYDIPVSPG